jgi:Spy/CpxP family protein refolding chaperone
MKRGVFVMRKGLVLLTAAVASLGSLAAATPASAQYHHGYDRGDHRGWHGDRGYHHGWDRHDRWRHDRARDYRYHHRHYRGGYYGDHHRGW